ncbi:MAG: TetR/AcrR family transcriptional regulator [Pseudobdellovibrionaceae bacterium]
MSKRKSKSLKEPRKEPKQERSRQTYQAILYGAAKIIRQSGVKNFSTNKVAQESGVSIGSLYQYFPSKEAIVAALIDQIFDHEYFHLKELLLTISPQIGAREVFKRIFSHYYLTEPEDRKYRKVMIEAVSWLDKNVSALNFHRAVAELIIGFSQEHFNKPPQGSDYEAVSLIIKYMLRATAHSSVDIDFEKIKLENLVNELAGILMGLLRIPDEGRNAVSEDGVNPQAEE